MAARGYAGLTQRALFDQIWSGIDEPSAQPARAANQRLIDTANDLRYRRGSNVLAFTTTRELRLARVHAGNKAGGLLVRFVVVEGARFWMVVTEGQARQLDIGQPTFGRFATPHTVLSQQFARDKLVILEEFKPDVSFVVQVETTAPQTVKRGITGPLEDYTGGVEQVAFIGNPAIKVGKSKRLPEQ